MFNKIGDLLPKIIAGRGMTTSVSAAHVCNSLREILSQSFNAHLLEHISVRSYKHSVVYVDVTHSVIAQELYHRKHELLALLQSKFEEKLIKDIVIKTAELKKH